MHWDFAEWQYARDGTRVSAPYKRIGEGPTAWHPPLYCPSQRCCYWLASSTAAGHYSDFSPDAASSGSSGSSSSGQGMPMPECCWSLARLLPLPRPYRVLNRGSVARGIAPAVGDHGPVGWLLHPSRPRPEEPKLSGNDRDTNRRPAHCSSAYRLGHRPTLGKDG